MSIGTKISKLRVKRGMTQKELGQAVGFSASTADVRIAQYEAGKRVPKTDTVWKLASILEVNPDYLGAPVLANTEETLRALFFLDEYNSVDLQSVEVKDHNTGGPRQKVFVAPPALDGYLEEWFLKKQALANKEISQDEYYEWKMNWKPDLD